MDQDDFSKIKDIVDALLPKFLAYSSILTVFYASKKTIDKFSLNKKCRFDDVSKIYLPPELTFQENEVDFKRISSKKYSESILKFINVFIDNFPKENLINFYNNINSLKVQSKNIYSKTGDMGLYVIKKNLIYLDDNISDVVIFHELFHMASSLYRNGVYYSGFSQAVKNKGAIGKGLNEGYTELLTQRYFNVNSSAYLSHVIIAERIEKIIGKEKMENLYFNSNLYGLINEFKQYSTEEDFINFLFNMDFCLKIFDLNIQPFEEKIICSLFTSIYKFLVVCYAKKRYSEVKRDSEIAKNMKSFVDDFLDFLVSLPQAYEVKGKVFSIMSVELMNECILLASKSIDYSIPLISKKIV